MKAVFIEQYGSPEVLQIQEVEKPTPKENEVLIKVRATTVNSGDCRIRACSPPFGFKTLFRLMFGFWKPRKKMILGTEVSGEVEAVGEKVTRFKQGDLVMAFLGFSMGAHAEYVCVAEDGVIVPKPERLSLEETAALAFGGTTALSYLRDKIKVQAGQKVLINGASGSVGVAAIQIAKFYGAEVTGVCSSANAELVQSLGADHVVDYTKEDFTQSDKRYDVILDAIGNLRFSDCKRALVKGGKLGLVAGNLLELLLIPWRSLISGVKLFGGPAAERREDLLFLRELVDAGKLRILIERRFPLSEIAEAHRLVDSGRKKGSVLVMMNP